MFNKLKTCRCCLTETAEESELYEFSSEVSVNPETAKPQFVKIANVFKESTSIEISEGEEDTSKVCVQCLGDLKFSYMFLKKCWESERVYTRVGKIQAVEEPEYMEYVEEYIEELPDDHENSNETIENDESDGIKAEFHSDMERADYEIEEIEEATTAIDIERKAKFRDIFQRSKQQNSNSDSRAVMKKRTGFECNFCDKVSQSKGENEAHEEEEHAEESYYKCRKCSAKFSSKANARLHFATAHANDEKTFACDTCPKTFKNRYQLVLHTRSHTGEKPFKCWVCQRCFSMSSNLQKHLDTHSTEKNFPCNECNQHFKTQRSLKFHTICYHQPEAKVKCPQCDKSFVNKSYLKMHMLYHTGEKNYTCTLCGSKYYKSSHLKRHIQNVHFKLRLLKCEFCASDFVRKETYRAHVISHHKRHLSDKEYEGVMERIRKFQPPSLDINEYTQERQTVAGFMLKTEIEEGEHEAQESIVEEGEDMVMQDGYFEPGSEFYNEEEDADEDEQ